MFRIFGPPGTGKTTKLLNMVDQALSNGVNPRRLRFLLLRARPLPKQKKEPLNDSTWTQTPTCFTSGRYIV
jgi:hypothetical protein